MIKLIGKNKNKHVQSDHENGYLAKVRRQT